MTRFSNERGDTRVGSFQGRDGYCGGTRPTIEPRPEASAAIVVVAGACCLLSATREDVCRRNAATDLLFNEDGTGPFVAGCRGAFAHDKGCDVRWRREGPAADGIVPGACSAAHVGGAACHDPMENDGRSLRHPGEDGTDV